MKKFLRSLSALALAAIIAASGGVSTVYGAASQVTLSYASGTKIFAETDLENTAVTIVAAAATIYLVEIDNTANAAQVNYCKLWDTAGAVTVGTTAPDWVIRIPAGVKRSISMADGFAMANGIVGACVTGAGTAGTTSPTSSIVFKMVYTS